MRLSNYIDIFTFTYKGELFTYKGVIFLIAEKFWLFLVLKSGQFCSRNFLVLVKKLGFK